MRLFVGIDVSSQDLKICAMNIDGDTLDAFTVLNNYDGATHLRDKLLSLADKVKPEEIHIGLESTSVYSWHPAMFLHEDSALQDRPMPRCFSSFSS